MKKQNLLAILFMAFTAIPVSARHHRPVSIRLKPQLPLRFIAYGDTRFTDPANTNAASAEVRQQLIRAIADAHPDFVTFGGDIAYNGDKPEDWQVYDRETGIWRELPDPRRVPRRLTDQNLNPTLATPSIKF